MGASREPESGEHAVFAGSCALHAGTGEIEGGFTELEGERFYSIRNYDRMEPFFMSVVSDSNHWMFISSNGALTCGRRNPESALFPYTTDDKIHDAQGQVGPVTIMRVEGDAGKVLWEPFSDRYEGVYELERSIFKNIPGNKLVFEEVNRSLGLSFRYAWLSSERFGFVRRVVLTNHRQEPVRLRLVDGLRNILPAMVDRSMQNNFSTLVDAYKKSELLPASGIGIYSLSSVPVDRAEPSESLLANIAWSTGLEAPAHLLCDRQLDAFRRGEAPVQEEDARGLRGAYFLEAAVDLEPGESREWFMVAEIEQDAGAIAALDQELTEGEGLVAELMADIDRGTQNLRTIVGDADGLQESADRLQTARHFSNTLCNVMRGGIFADGYTILKEDFTAYVRGANRPVAECDELDGLPERFSRAEGLAFVEGRDDPDLERLFFEYLPLTFSRRHGDPSRPWNAFSIETQNPDGSRKLYYAGNWRDIFQNWEALGWSFPEFLEGMVCKFVNASTADGYNPYRITRDGIDWEVHDPDDPWSNIGYWGDHQVVYLLKLLEHSAACHPGRLEALLGREIFTYADVPYRIRPYEDLLADPRDTIEFDQEAHDEALARADRIGSDGKLVHDADGAVLRVNLAEKLLVPILAKLANFIPGAGIWMNTQRPEWNDANNALVGYGVSVVTLCYFRRYLEFLHGLFASCEDDAFPVSGEIAGQFRAMQGALAAHHGQLADGFDPSARRALLDELGGAGSAFRAAIHARGFSGEKATLELADLKSFLELANAYLDETITTNRRDDGLYHSYNLMEVDAEGGIAVGRLGEMLEGQVAVLSSGVLGAEESLALLESLRASPLYREDQHSYLLYADRDLPRFMEKNCIPAGVLDDADPRVVRKDCRGTLHFHPSLRNAGELAKVLDESGIPESERERYLTAYEEVFDHRSFTGRSGTFFKYEGLGCIYWHMVSKLLLAVQETCVRAKAAGEPDAVVRGLMDHYYQVRRGVGAHKPVTEQGAFPIDPYSHTPSMMGAQQPGLTGQVKEDFMARLFELGIRVEDGCLRFDPFLVPEAEWADGRIEFTFCAVPIVMVRGDAEEITVVRENGESVRIDGLALDDTISREVFERSGSIARIEVTVRS